MGGARAVFTVERNGRQVEMTADVPYNPSDTGVAADANLVQAELDLARQAIQGLLVPGQTVIGDVRITEYSGDPHASLTGTRAIATMPAAVLFGSAGAVGAVPPVTGGATGGPVQVVPTSEVSIWPEDQNRGQWHGRMCSRQPDGTWRLVNAMATPGGAGPNPSPPPPPPVTGGDAGGTPGPRPRRPAPGGGAGHVGPRPPSGGGGVSSIDPI